MAVDLTVKIEAGLRHKSRAEHPLQSGMNLGKQSPDAVTRLGNLLSEIIVKPAQEHKLREGLIRSRQRPQGVRHRAGRLGDDGGIPCIGLSLAFMRSAMRRMASPGRYAAAVNGN